MCEVNAYLKGPKGESEIMTEVDSADVQGDYVILRGVLGQEKRVKGKLRLVSFGQHRLVVEQAA